MQSSAQQGRAFFFSTGSCHAVPGAGWAQGAGLELAAWRCAGNTGKIRKEEELEIVGVRLPCVSFGSFPRLGPA